MWIWTWVKVRVQRGLLWFIGWIGSLVWKPIGKSTGKQIPTGHIEVDPSSCPGVSEDLSTRDKGSFRIGVVETLGWPVIAGQTIDGSAIIVWPPGESLPNGATPQTSLALKFATLNAIAGHQADSAVAPFGGNSGDEFAFRVANDATQVVLSVGGHSWTATKAASGGLAWHRADGSQC